MATTNEKCQLCRARILSHSNPQITNCSRCGAKIHSQPNMNNGSFPISDANGTQTNGRVIGAAVSAYSNAIRQSVANKVQQRFSNRVQLVQTFLRSQMLVPPVREKKRAVLCGVSYKGHPKSLNASINNVSSMKYLLLEKLEFSYPSVLILTEDEKDPSRIPTKKNIRAALRWLVQGCQAGDSLLFYYSGHGSRIRDLDGDEKDGHDSALCPVDYETEGRIIDDEINALIVGPLPRGVTLHAIIDTCFSGTFLDVQYMCRVKKEGYYLWEDQRMPNAPYKGTQGGLAICISACDDHQTSGDTTAFTGTPAGALTHSFVKMMEKQQKITYAQLLIAMRNKVQGAQKAAGQKGPLEPSLLQEPQLSASETFDIHLKQFIL